MIPFVRTQPNGTRVAIEIDRPAEIEAIAARFLRTGGRYQITILQNLRVMLAATIPTGEGNAEDMIVESVETTNDQALPKAVDDIVRLSDLHVQALWIGDVLDLPAGHA